MKMVNQAGVGSSLVGRVDFDEFTAARRCSGLCPSANRASDSKRNGALQSRSRFKPDGERVPRELSRRFNSSPCISALSRPNPGFGPPGHKSSHKAKLRG